MGAGVARPGISSARGARAVFYHQAKVIVVLEAVAAFESKGCQRGVIHHLLCPLVGLAVARGCPAAGLLEQVYQTFKASSSAAMRFISAATYAGQFVRMASSLSSV